MLLLPTYRQPTVLTYRRCCYQGAGQAAPMSASLQVQSYLLPVPGMCLVWSGFTEQHTSHRVGHLLPRASALQLMVLCL